MPTPLVDVPAPVAQVAAAALAARIARREGGTARGVVIATSLAGGHATPAELHEARDWHRRNPEAVREGRSTLLAGLYGGGPGRSWLAAVDGIVGAARNPDGQGAMIALPVDPVVAKTLARDDGEPAGSYHLTLFHLGNDASQLDPALRDAYTSTVARTIAGMTPPTVNLSHVERFSPTDEGLEPVVAVSDDAGVYLLRQQLEETLDAAGLGYSDDHAFRAHVTIGYYPPGDGPAAGPIEALSWTPDAVELFWGAEATRSPLAGTQPVAAAAGWYVMQDGYPVSGPHSEKAAARADAEPADDGIVYLDGTLPFGVLARAAAPVDRQLRRRRARLRRLQVATAQVDRDLARKVQAAAETALREALRKAGVNLRQKARTGAQKDVLVAAGGLATPTVLAALGLEAHRLVEHSFTAVGDLFAQWAAAAERRKLALAAKILVPDPTLGETPSTDHDSSALDARFGAEIDRRADLAAGLFVAGLGFLALRRLSTGPEVPSPGEVHGDVPFRIVRGPLELVRTGRAPTGGFDGPAIREVLSDASSLVDTIMREREPTAERTGGEWVHGYYGEPNVAFEPHFALDGVGGEGDPDGPLDGPYDERLANTEDWPDGSYFAPDDHAGCACERLEAVDIPAPIDVPEALAAAVPAPVPAMPAVARVLARVAEPA